jgi:hypothetical protein
LHCLLLLAAFVLCFAAFVLCVAAFVICCAAQLLSFAARVLCFAAVSCAAPVTPISTVCCTVRLTTLLLILAVRLALIPTTSCTVCTVCLATLLLFLTVQHCVRSAVFSCTVRLVGLLLLLPVHLRAARSAAVFVGGRTRTTSTHLTRRHLCTLSETCVMRALGADPAAVLRDVLRDPLILNSLFI